MTQLTQTLVIADPPPGTAQSSLPNRPVTGPGPAPTSRRAKTENEGEHRGWLCPTKADRARLTDMSPAVRRARLLVGLFCGAGVLAVVPWTGWRTVVVFAVVPAPLLLLDRFIARARHPERLVLASLSLYLTLMVVGVGVSGGVRSPALPWVAIPVLAAAARFRLAVFLAFTSAAAGALVLVTAVADYTTLIHDPAPLIGAIVLLGALAALQRPLLDAETRWRRDAVLDPLTGLLNRQGLPRRFREVAEQARLTDQPVSLVAFDLDEFKLINDVHGHTRGDAVLKDVAYALRKTLRSFELLYRVGGEELLLILPGTELTDGCRIAERVRIAIEQSEPAGLIVTASFGVCSAIGEAIEYASMYEGADRALYQAKRAGRNRVAFLPRVADERALLEPVAA
jgi:diguanylate cyclase (GGDEF)-like protein